MARPSLRWRLVGGGVAAILLALALAGGALAYLFQRHASRTLSEDLDVHLRQLVGALDVDTAGKLTLRKEPVDPRFADPLSGLYWQVDGARDVLRSRSLWDQRIVLPDDTIGPGEVHRHVAIGPAGRRVLIAERIVTLSELAGGQPLRVVVATDLARIDEATAAFTRDLVLALGILALALALATTLQVAIGLRPLARISRNIAEIRSGAARRMPGSAPVEVQPLSDEINALLDAQEREVERSRGRAADLAHGLKTPLAALAGDVRRLRGNGQEDVADDIEQVADAMRRHVDRELARARIRGAASRKEAPRVALAPLAGSIAAMLARGERGDGIAVRLDVPEGTALAFDREDLAEVLGNLLENAVRHARSVVRLCAEQTSAGFAVSIDDDGPGLAADARAAMLARGVRLDRRGSGAGLGLAIVHDVLEAYGWQIELTASDLGGLGVRLRGPA
ncbi:MAG: HAMP domain-containing sensor histidine kinase [Hyphomicrobiaceae bacterium]